MRAIISFSLLILILTSCNQNKWIEDIQEEVRVFNNTQKEEGVYFLKRNSSTGIFLTKYESRFGMEKLKMRHINNGILDFERHFFFKDSALLYAYYVGIAPQSKQETKIKFIAFNKHYFWKNKGEGLLVQQEVVSDSFYNQKQVLNLLNELETKRREVASDEYTEMLDYIEKMKSFETQEVTEKDYN